MFLCSFFLFCHIVCCIWVIAAQIEKESNEDSWINQFDQEEGSGNIYLTSFYFTVTTITTVGYGDMSGGTTAEMIICIFFMVAGIISFSMASGTLSSIIKTYDT